MKKIKWSRDEIIVALSFYHTEYPPMPSINSIEIKKLYEILQKIHFKNDYSSNGKYRSVNSVRMILCNFLYWDPKYPGGLSRGSKTAKKIFQEFQKHAPDYEELHKHAKITQESSEISD